MKKRIAKRLCIIIFTTTLVTMILNYYLQIKTVRLNMERNANLEIDQMEDAIAQSQTTWNERDQWNQRDVIYRTKSVAFLISQNPQIVFDAQQLQEMMNIFQIEELNLFDAKGQLYASSNPDQIGSTLYTNSHFSYFLPMLDDVTLSMVEPTAFDKDRHKRIRYSAVWDTKQENIIQVGIDVQQNQQWTEQNDLSYIFALSTPTANGMQFAVQKDTGEIVGATNHALVGLSCEEAGLQWIMEKPPEGGFSITILGESQYCVVRESGDLLLGVAVSNAALYSEIEKTVWTVTIYLLLSALVMIVAILQATDRYIIRSIDTIVEKLVQITQGDLDTKVDVNIFPEFEKLSFHINQMVESLLHNTTKISKIFDVLHIPIGVYEYNRHMKRVLATDKVRELLLLSEEDFADMLSDQARFEKYIQEIQQKNDALQKNAIRISGHIERYVKIQSFSDGHNTIGIIADVSEEIMERKQLEHDRDYDILTGLLNRRGFYSHMDVLFETKNQLLTSALILMDMNGLKGINDTYGHVYGDAAIQAAAQILNRCSAEQKIISRLGGDEFALFLYGYEKEMLEHYIKEIQEEMMQTSIPLPNGTTHPIRLAGGYLFYPDYTVGYTTLLRLADIAMYRAKKQKKSEFMSYRPIDDIFFLEHQKNAKDTDHKIDTTIESESEKQENPPIQKEGDA